MGVGEREMQGRVGREDGGQKAGEGEGEAEGRGLRVPPSQTPTPEPYLRPEGNRVKERWA